MSARTLAAYVAWYGGVAPVVSVAALVLAAGETSVPLPAVLVGTAFVAGMVAPLLVGAGTVWAKGGVSAYTAENIEGSVEGKAEWVGPRWVRVPAPDSLALACYSLGLIAASVGGFALLVR